MNKLIEQIIKSDITSVFTITDLCNSGLKKEYVTKMLQDAVVAGDVINITNDIFTLGRMLRKELISEEVIACKLVPNSYVSMEYVLSLISWIPENVYTVTCVTDGQSRYIGTQFGNYEFVNIPQKVYDAGVVYIQKGIYRCKRAKPLKALADIILNRNYIWTTLKPLHESLRIEYDDLETLTTNDFNELDGTYGVSNVENFLNGIRKELAV